MCRGQCVKSIRKVSVFGAFLLLRSDLCSISPYSVRMRENTDQKSSKYGLFSRSGQLLSIIFPKEYTNIILLFYNPLRLLPILQETFYQLYKKRFSNYTRNVTFRLTITSINLDIYLDNFIQNKRYSFKCNQFNFCFKQDFRFFFQIGQPKLIFNICHGF